MCYLYNIFYIYIILFAWKPLMRTSVKGKTNVTIEHLQIKHDYT